MGTTVTGGKRGSAVIVALVVVASIAVLTMALLRLGVSFNAEQFARVDNERALFAAEAGLHHAVNAIKLGNTGSVASEPTPARFGDGVVWVTSQSVANDMYLLTSCAMVESGRQALQLLVFHYEDSVAESAALFGDDPFVLGERFFADSFDSSLGTYEEQLAATPDPFVAAEAVIGSNGDIQLDTDAEIHGDAHPGVGSAVVFVDATVSGVLEPYQEPRTLPPVVPPGPYGATDFVVPQQGIAALGPGSIEHRNLELGEESTLTIVGPAQLLLEDLRLFASSTLVADTTGGEIVIYVDDDVHLFADARLATPDESAVGVELLMHGSGSGSRLRLDPGAAFYGRVYAPECWIELQSSSTLYGAAVAETLEVHDDVTVHFDQALLAASPSPEKLVFGNYAIAPFPRPDFLTNRADPFQLLGVSPGDLPLVGDAYDL